MGLHHKHQSRGSWRNAQRGDQTGVTHGTHQPETFQGLDVPSCFQMQPMSSFHWIACQECGRHQQNLEDHGSVFGTGMSPSAMILHTEDSGKSEKPGDCTCTGSRRMVQEARMTKAEEEVDCRTGRTR